MVIGIDQYEELRPRLRRIYLTTNRSEVYLPVLEPLSGRAIPDGIVELDRHPYHGLLVGGRALDLTPLELEVMHYLRLNEGAAVSRHALLGDIWATTSPGAPTCSRR